jgi:hypothetical protein
MTVTLVECYIPKGPVDTHIHIHYRGYTYRFNSTYVSSDNVLVGSRIAQSHIVFHELAIETGTGSIRTHGIHSPLQATALKGTMSRAPLSNIFEIMISVLFLPNAL